MIRSTPTSGRMHRVLTVAALLCSALVALPAAAQEPTEAPTEVPAVDVVVPAQVMGVDPLRVTLPPDVDAAAVQITDASDAVSRWIVDAEDTKAAEEPGELAFDLNAPDEGDIPLNGPASIAITIDDVEVLAANLLLDRAPAAPVLSAKRSRGQVALNWPAVAGPGDVTYRVDRAAVGQAWVVLRRELTHSAYLDSSVTPGTYRYRVTAAVAAAKDGVNRSAPALATVRVTGPATSLPEPPQPPPPPETPEPDAGPTPSAPVPDPQPSPRRNVAVTGDIKRPVDPSPPPAPRRQTGQPDFSQLETTYRFQQPAPAPSIAAAATPDSPAPEVAKPRMQPLPVPVGPVGMLAVEAADGVNDLRVGDVATLAAIALLSVLFLARRPPSGRRRALPGQHIGQLPR